MLPRPFNYSPPLDPYLSLIYHDDDILVLDKPCGLLTVAGNSPKLADCLEMRAKEQFPQAKIVHRLDKDTSGVIVLGLNKEAHANLGMQFEKRRVKKKYIAKVWGKMGEDFGRVDEPIITDWVNRPKQMIDYERGRSAITDWEVIEGGEEDTRVLLRPITGRSHQLRVHMNFLGNPILGDNLYAHDEALAASSRLLLHAQYLEFFHPVTAKKCSFEVECPF